jgi:hypothetical protein
VAVTAADTYKYQAIPPGGVTVMLGVPTAPYVKFDVADQIAWRVVEI